MHFIFNDKKCVFIFKMNAFEAHVFLFSSDISLFQKYVHAPEIVTGCF